MRVLIDANVLYPTVMREVVLGAAAAGLFAPRWSARIEEEWARAAARHGAAEEALARGEIARLALAFPGARVTGFEAREAKLWLPDPADIHVLAAAIHGSCDVILTSNAKDFPRGLLAEEGLSRADPDGFLLGLMEARPEVLGDVVEGVLAEARRLSGEDWTVRSLMRKARLPRLGKAVERWQAGEGGSAPR